MRPALACLWSGLALATAGTAQEASNARQPHEFLSKYASFSEGQLRDLDDGKVVVEVLDTDVKREFAIGGAVRIAAPLGSYRRWLGEIDKFEKDGKVLQIGRLAGTSKQAEPSSSTGAVPSTRSRV